MKQKNKIKIEYLEAQVISTLEGIRKRDEQIALLKKELEIKDIAIKTAMLALKDEVGKRYAI